MSIPPREAASRLTELYERQAAKNRDDYLQAHSASAGGILRQIEAAALYLPYVSGRVLDWGCMHGVDAWLVRMHLGNSADIHGCDIFNAERFSIFHEAAQLRYKEIEPAHSIPYPNGHFDTVIADGVLEHVPNDHESLKELYRILRTDGLLVISCLPNSLSYLECLARCLGLPHHLRTYTMGMIRAMLLHSGFEVIYYRHLQMMPTLSGVGMLSLPAGMKRLSSALWRANGVLEKIWPLNRLSSNLLLLARKRLAITWAPRQAA